MIIAGPDRCSAAAAGVNKNTAAAFNLKRRKMRKCTELYVRAWGGGGARRRG